MFNLISILLTAITTFATPLWLKDINLGKEEAAQQHKLIVLNFSGSDWCGPCIRLKKEIFASESFQAFAANNLVLVNADFPRYKKNALPKDQVKKNEALADKYNAGGKFPYTLLLDADGNVLHEWEGFPNVSPEQFVEEIKTIAHVHN